MRIFKGILLAGMALLLVAVVNPAIASCGAATIMTTITTSRSYIWNPAAGFVPNYNYPPYVLSYTPPVSSNIAANFWALGTGDPVSGAGDDSDGFPTSAFFYFYGPGAYGSYFGGNIFGGWGQAAQIDGCIVNTIERCTCMLLTDSAGGGSQYAMLAARANASGDTSFVQPGNDGSGNSGPIIMQDIPAPSVLTSAKNGNGVNLTVAPVGLDGLYQKDGCDCGAGAIVRVMAREEPEGGAPPATRDAGQWTQIGSGPLGGPIAASAACDSFAAVDLYLATQILFDPASGGGFPATVVSANSTRVSCGSNPTLADPVDIERPRIKPGKPVTTRGEGRGR